MEEVIISSASENDIPEIVGLLKLSLGESLMPKTEAYWRWKHIENPFGKSHVLLAKDRNKLIGVRAFMRWEWKKGGKVVKAVRAVDTATHPDYQGKGIFKKLTLLLLEECTQQEFDLVFNTPNQKSKPGYIKMGWQEVGKIPINIQIKKPQAILRSMLFGKSHEFLNLNSHTFNLPRKMSSIIQHKWCTHYSSEYLHWRYLQIPVIDYYTEENESASIIYRLKRTPKGTELRITDVFGEKPDARKLIKKMAKQTDCDYVTLSGFYKDIMPGLFNFKAAIGPQVTVREISHSAKDFYNFKNWSPCLGDMEVF